MYESRFFWQGKVFLTYLKGNAVDGDKGVREIQPTYCDRLHTAIAYRSIQLERTYRCKD